MEPRPQRPQPKAPAQGTPIPPGVPQQQPMETGQFVQQQAYDPGVFMAPQRTEYDYSPLDLQPPSQRRKRQVIAAIIGALAVVAIGALIVAGWIALRDSDSSPTSPSGDRVSQVETKETEESSADAAATPAPTTVATTAVPTAPPTIPSTVAKVYDVSSIRSALPVVESMPGAFSEAGDLPQDLATVIEALGGTQDVETMLTTNGWQAAMARTFVSDDPANTGSTQIVVSVHAFKDATSAQAALPAYANILEGFGWTSIDGETFGDGSRTLVWADPNTGDDAITIYVVDGQLLYRVFAIGPAGTNSTPNAVYVVHQILGR